MYVRRVILTKKNLNNNNNRIERYESININFSRDKNILI